MNPPSSNSFDSAVSPGQPWLRQLLQSNIMLMEDWQALPESTRTALQAIDDQEALLRQLVEHHLLTDYQAARIQAGTIYGLVLGNYRIFDRLGAGGMGVVFRGEHILMRREVAIKVMPLSSDRDQRLLQRFYTEIRTIAKFQHPNIVIAMDAGFEPSPDGTSPSLHYLVMEYVVGQDLEQLVQVEPLPVPRACDIIYQAASALDEAHRHNLVHRDIKPSNIMVTQEGQVKVLDFGLTRLHDRHHATEPGTILGTIDYMAPEQARDATRVDIRADIYALGGTLFFCLTGRPPFLSTGAAHEQLMRRLTQPPPRLRTVCPEIPENLERVVLRMMALNPDERYSTPQAVMRALLPFLPQARNSEIRSFQAPHSKMLPKATVIPASPSNGQHAVVTSAARRVLVADDDGQVRQLCRITLEAEGFQCLEACDGQQALQVLHEQTCDLLLVDVDMPHLSGPEVLRAVRQKPPCRHFKAILMSGHMDPDEMARMLSEGADDCLLKPLSLVQMTARVKSALLHKEAQDRAEQLTDQLLAINAELEKSLTARDSDLIQVRNALVLALAKLVERRTNQTTARLFRLPRYCRALAEEAARQPDLAKVLTPTYMQLLESCVPLHDIGNVALPDHILLKPGKLDPDERIIMQSHTIVGAETLQLVARRGGTAVAFLQMAIDIARHHHERYDGSGYPDRLSGTAIPLAARIVTIGDVYDALRSRRTYRPGLSHSAALQIITFASAGHFDPNLLQAFQRCASEFERIFREMPDGVEM